MVNRIAKEGPAVATMGSRQPACANGPCSFVAICTRAIVMLLMLVRAGSTLAAPPAAILLDDFEDGVAAWETNDSTVTGTGHIASLCGIYAASSTTQVPGQRAAMIDFAPAKDAWASVSLPVNGKQWVENQAGQLSLWLNGITDNRVVQVRLRARVPVAGGGGEERIYSQNLHISVGPWQHVTLRFFGFRSQDGTALDEETVAHIFMLQFVKTGTWDRVRFHVDQIEVQPADYGGRKGPPDQLPETIVVDFSEELGRCLGQVGFNVAANSPAFAGDTEVRARITSLTADLTPCVGRLRLGDFYTPQARSFDIAGLNRNVNWLLARGVRPLICLDLPEERGQPGVAAGHEAVARLRTVSTKLAELRRGTEMAPYYELYDAPMERQFAEVSELANEYNRFAAALREADSSARIGGPGFVPADSWHIKEFLAGARPLYFLSYALRIEGPTSASDRGVFDAALHGRHSGSDELRYEDLAALLDTVKPSPELFITDWGVNASATATSEAIVRKEAAEATFLAASALGASRYADKLLWTRLADDSSGLLDTQGQPRPAYWAAWLLSKYAPRGASFRGIIRCSPDVVIAAVSTRYAANLFIVNAADHLTTVRVKVTGIPEPMTVRERKLDLGEANTVQHYNLSLSTTQQIKFQGPGVSVVQFINLSGGSLH
jgi:hypothetical protein